MRLVLPVKKPPQTRVVVRQSRYQYRYTPQPSLKESRAPWNRESNGSRQDKSKEEKPHFDTFSASNLCIYLQQTSLGEFGRIFFYSPNIFFSKWKDELPVDTVVD